MNRHRHQRPAFSLMMVTAVVAVASVLSLAVLSSNTLQAQASANQDKAVAADALAESGINLGLYYLQNLHDATKCPSGLMLLTTGSSTFAQNNNTLGAAVPGTFDLTFNRPSLTQYVVTATGKSTAATGTISRTLTATCEVNYYGYGISAPNATTALTVPANTIVTGGVYAPAGGTNGGGIAGLIYTLTASLGLSTTQAPPIGVAPGAVNHFLVYNINGKSGTATTVLPGTYKNATWGTPVNSLNPAGVYYCPGNFDMDGNLKITGTLVTGLGGSLRVAGTGNSITPYRYFPAAVVEGDLKLKSASTTIDLAGLTYVGGHVTRSGSGANYKVNVTGALVFANTAPTIDSLVSLTVNYDRYKASVLNLVSSGRPVPTSISISSWRN